MAKPRKRKPRKLDPPYYYLVAEHVSNRERRWYEPITLVRYKIYSLGDTIDVAMKDFTLSGIFEANFCSFKIYKVNVGGGRTKVADISNS